MCPPLLFDYLHYTEEKVQSQIETAERICYDKEKRKKQGAEL